MHRRGNRTAYPPVSPCRVPNWRSDWEAANHQHMVVSPRDSTHFAKESSARVRLQTIMTKHDPRTPWQRRYAGQQRIAKPLISHQPYFGQ